MKAIFEFFRDEQNLIDWFAICMLIFAAWWLWDEGWFAVGMMAFAVLLTSAVRWWLREPLK